MTKETWVTDVFKLKSEVRRLDASIALLKGSTDKNIVALGVSLGDELALLSSKLGDVEAVLPSLGLPGGSTGQVQYNNNDAFGGANLYYDNTTGRIAVGVSTTPLAKLHVVGELDEIQTIIQAWETQAANAFELRNSNAVVLASFAGFDSTSGFQVNQADTTNVLTVDTTNARAGIGTATPGAKLDIDGKANEIQLIVQAHSTQTENLQEWQSSDGTVLARVLSNGRIVNIVTSAGTSQSGIASLIYQNGNYQNIIGLQGIVDLRSVNSTRLGTESPVGLRGEIVATNGANVLTHAEAAGFRAVADVRNNNTITALNMVSVINPNASGGGSIVTLNGLKIDNLTAATTNRAIKTGRGVVELGDTVLIDGWQDAVQLTVQAHSTQIENILEIQDSSDNALLGADKGGVLFMAEVTTPTAAANFGKVYPKTDNNLYFQDGAGTEKTLHDSNDTVTVDLSLETYDAEPARSSVTNLHGGILSLATGQPLDSVPTDIVVTKGIGKVMIVINAGSDFSGDITITGETIDRDTGASTPADTDTITVDTSTTDEGDTDTNGNTRYHLVDAYISSKWFTGTVTLSTTNLTLTSVDVYHVSFEQFNDSPSVTLNTFDANIFTTHANAEFDAYLYCLEVTGDKCSVTRCSSLNVGADGETAIANKYWRLRRGNIAKALDGTTDGVWVDVHYSNNPAYVEDVNIKVWASKEVSMTIN